MECDDDWPVNNHAPDPNHGAHRGGTNCVRDRFYCTPATRQSQYARPAAATTHRSKHTPRQNARASSKGGTRHDRRSPSICADQSTDGTADRSRIGTATLGACGYVAIPDNATRFDTASDDAHPYATNTAGDRICAKGNQWTDGRTIHSISRNRCYCHGDCDGGWSTDTPHNARGCCATPNTIRPANGKSTKRRCAPSCPEHRRTWTGGWPRRWNRDWRKRGDDPTACWNNCGQSAATFAANHGTQRHTNHTRPNGAAYPANAGVYIAHFPNDAKRKRGCFADTKRVIRPTRTNNRGDCADTDCAPNQ